MTTNELSRQALQLPAQHHAKLISAAYLTADEITMRCEERLPGTNQLFRTQALVVVGGKARGPLGTFTAEKWEHDGQRLHEIHLNADRRCGHATATTGEDATVTIAHELAHLYAHAHGIQDTSNRGRYHSNRFARIAGELGCNTVRPANAPYGIITDRLSDWGRDVFADLVGLMDEALRLNAAPNNERAFAPAVAPAEPVQANSKYVFASCQCIVAGRPRTFRMSVRQWTLGPVWCGRCCQPFTDGTEHPAESQPFWSSFPVGASTLPLPARALSPFVSKEI
ncbi:hypothetical protein [Microbacterium capsulatum]|uniref:SprT-like domain-containing protein n=1 Tax=Microbacterium capsulatum TaxID=3041921 RepID=A0ABU0XI08_9MICO|nr:hypothetical protein [Microbacterium sp. ASV81]MDQ4214756.1 hypothetical protein [Microbacterium sp. ASV81]